MAGRNGTDKITKLITVVILVLAIMVSSILYVEHAIAEARECAHEARLEAKNLRGVTSEIKSQIRDMAKKIDRITEILIERGD